METVEGERNGKNARGKLQKKGNKNNAPIKGNKRCSGSKTCHHCRRNDKGHVVQCRSCKRKRYCMQCLKTWKKTIFEEEDNERKKKRKLVAEMDSKEHEQFEQADREADDWRARELHCNYICMVLVIGTCSCSDIDGKDEGNCKA